MKIRINNYPTLLLAALALLLLSCVKEPDVPEPPVGRTIHYSATVEEGTVTRATLDGGNHYIFETGDRLYVVNTGADAGDLHGILTLVSGAGQTSATFAGELTCEGDFEPVSSTPLSATLIGAHDLIHSFTGGILDAERNYPENVFTSTLADAVSRYSDFISTGAPTFDSHAFTLAQQSSFLVFSVKYSAETVAADTPVTARVFNGGQSPIWTATVYAVASSLTSTRTDFVIAFPGGSTSLSGASFSVTWGNNPEDQYEDSLNNNNNITLAVNTYYNVTRTTIEDHNYFRIKATQASTNVWFNYNYEDSGIEYSVDEGAHWEQYTSGNIELANAGDVIWVRGSRSNYSNINPNDTWGGPDDKPIFRADKKCYIAGNVMTLLADKDNIAAEAFRGAFSRGNTAVDYIDIDPDDPLLLPATTLADNCYKNMFRNCTFLIRTPDLPADVLANGCYSNMFRQCTRLTTIPSVLAATQLYEDCYREMFRGCTALVSGPSGFLPSTDLATSCYQQMFNGCTKLASTPALPATTLASHCYDTMFSGCTKLTTAPALPATTLVSGCYYQMFSGCSILAAAPALPATTLASECYRAMFTNCTTLTSSPVLAATTLASSCYYEMFKGCTGLTTAPALPATTLTGATSCYRGMFQGCTKLTSGPALSATTLANNCYQSMFQGCTGLTSAPALPATTLAGTCYQSMFQGCTSLTTAPDLTAATLVSNCYNSMFSGCTSLNYIKCLAQSGFNASNCLKEWVKNVSGSGTFYYYTGVTNWVADSNNGIPTGWTAYDTTS